MYCIVLHYLLVGVPLYLVYCTTILSSKNGEGCTTMFSGRDDCIKVYCISLPFLAVGLAKDYVFVISYKL